MSDWRVKWIEEVEALCGESMNASFIEVDGQIEFLFASNDMKHYIPDEAKRAAFLVGNQEEFYR